jgi:hypothetical protein
MKGGREWGRRKEEGWEGGRERKIKIGLSE